MDELSLDERIIGKEYRQNVGYLSRGYFSVYNCHDIQADVGSEFLPRLKEETHLASFIYTFV
jgi:hypothetical protein